MRAHISNAHTYVRMVYDRLWRCTSKDSCILPRECDIGDSSLSGKELQAAHESVRDVVNDCARAHHRHSAIQLDRTVGLQSTKLYGECHSLWHIPLLVLRRSPWLAGKYWSHSIDTCTLSASRWGCRYVICAEDRSKSPNLKFAKFKNTAFWLKSPNLMPAKFSRYTVAEGLSTAIRRKPVFVSVSHKQFMYRISFKTSAGFY